MARGWESKAIESQQDEAARARALRGRRDLTPEERATLEQRRLLELELKHARELLAKTTAPARRQSLESAIDDLTRRIEGLTPFGD